MTTAASQIQLTVIEEYGAELIVLEAPGAQVISVSDEAPLPLGTAAPGTSFQASRANHVHAHGNQTGGSLHALATSGAAGFMPSTDKAKLDAASTANTANSIVQRDASGNFSAGTITAAGVSTTGSVTAGQVVAIGATPAWRIEDTNAGVDNGKWDVTVGDGPLIIQALNDAGAGGGSNWQFTRNVADIENFIGYRSAVERIRLSNFDNKITFSNALGIFGTATAHDLQIVTNNVERIHIDSAGRVGFGTSILGGTYGQYGFSGPISGNESSAGILYTPTIQPDSTTGVGVIYAKPATSANGGTPYTIANLNIYTAQQGIYDADSTITSQAGFVASSTLTGATNNFGFYSNLASAAGRWNFYANGTAPSYFAGDVRSNTSVTCRSAPVNSNVTATASASSLLDGIRTGTPAADIDLQLPTGTNMDAAFQDLQANQSFEWSVINLATAASGFDITVTANTDHTVVGNMVVAGETSGRFLTRKTAANTFITYRIA